MVSDKIVHRNKRKGRFVSVGPRICPVSRGIGIVVRCGACCSWSGNDLRARIMSDGWQITQAVGGSWYVTNWVGVVDRATLIAGRDRENRSLAAAGRLAYQSLP